MDITGSAPVAAGRPAKRILLPREHGAYGQLLFPIGTALALGGGSAPAFALALSCVSAFAAHESLLVLLGHRGARAAREQRQPASVWLIGCGTLAAGAAAFGVVRMPIPARAWLLLPAALSLALVWFIFHGREHSTSGEVVAASALSSCSIPIALAGGVSAVPAVTCWLVFVLAFVVATIAVRSMIARVKTARRPLPVPSAGGAGAWLASAVMALSVVGGAASWWPWAVPLALLPVCGIAAVLSLFPLHPRHLRPVGWSLVTATALTAVVLAVAFM